MMPTNELSSSLLLCVSVAAVFVLNTDVITLLLLVDTTEVVEVAVVVYTIVVIEVTGVVLMTDPAKVEGIIEVVSLLSIIELIIVLLGDIRALAETLCILSRVLLHVNIQRYEHIDTKSNKHKNSS